MKKAVERAKVNNSQSSRPQLSTIVEKAMLKNSGAPTNLQFNPSIYDMKETTSVSVTGETINEEPKGRIHADETDNSSIISEIKNRTSTNNEMEPLSSLQKPIFKSMAKQILVPKR